MTLKKCYIWVQLRKLDQIEWIETQRRKRKNQTYSGSGCSTGGSWGGRFWSEHLSQSLCRPTVPYTPHTEEVDPNRDSIVSKDSSTSGSFIGISVNKLVKWLQPCEKSSLCWESSTCSLLYLGLMISNRNHNNYNLPDSNGSCFSLLQISTVDVSKHNAPIAAWMLLTS